MEVPARSLAPSSGEKAKIGRRKHSNVRTAQWQEHTALLPKLTNPKPALASSTKTCNLNSRCRHTAASCLQDTEVT